MGTLLKDRNRIADAHQLFDPRGIPIRRANATMACGPPDGLRIIRAVNAYVRLVQPDPEHADRIIWTRRKVEELIRFYAMIEHALIVARHRQGRNAEDLP